MNKRMLKHRLVGGSGSGTGAGSGDTSAEIEAKMEVVGESLDRRASLEDLTNQGIFQVFMWLSRVCYCSVRDERVPCPKGRGGRDPRRVGWLPCVASTAKLETLVTRAMFLNHPRTARRPGPQTTTEGERLD